MKGTTKNWLLLIANILFAIFNYIQTTWYNNVAMWLNILASICMSIIIIMEYKDNVEEYTLSKQGHK